MLKKRVQLHGARADIPIPAAEKQLINASLTAPQISARSVQQLLSYEKGWTRAHAQICCTWKRSKTHSEWGTNHTPDFSTVCPVVPRKQKMSAHLRT